MGNHESCKDWGDKFCRHAFDCNDGENFKPKSAPMTDTKPSDVDGLIEQLLLLAAWRKPGGPTPKEKQPNTYKVATEAATTLAAQQAELDRIRATFDAPGGNLFDYVAKLEAENQRLRAALKEPS